MRRFAATLCLLVTGTLLLAGCPGKSGDSTPPGADKDEEHLRIQPVPSVERETRIYLVDLDKGKLVPVAVELPEGSTEEQLRSVVKALATAEETDSHVRCIPAGSALRGVALQDGTAVLDFEQNFTDPKFWAGSGTESLRVWGLVNALTELKDVREVRLLVDGEPIESLGGHVELSEPLRRDESLIRED